VIARSLALTLGLVLCWTALQVTWLQMDERIVEGDVMGNVGAAELFRVDRWRLSIPRVLARSYLEDFGEYPALFPAITGLALAAAGVIDLDGDAPSLVGLLWSWLALFATWLLGLVLAGPRVAWLSAALLMLSPLWTGMQRYLLLENGLCATICSATALALLALQSEGRGQVGRSWFLWLLAGLAGGASLLIKQTAVLALVPIAGVALVGLLGPAWRAAQQGGVSKGSAAIRVSRGACLAVVVALLLVAPWYLRQMGSHDGYLLRSLQSNPDAVGPLHQLLYYPLVLLQLPYAPLSLLGLGALGFLGRRHAVSLPAEIVSPAGWPARKLLLVAVLAGLVLLIFLPKKYPRLLIPLLPLLAVAFACMLQRWSALHRGLALGLLSLSLLASSFSLGPLSALLGPTHVGLVDVDERCFQSWVEAPLREGMDWAALLAALEEAGGPGEPYLVGADLWPVAPCSHQTTHDLGQHLRLRARRSGLEARVLAGEDSWEIAGRWREGPPQVLLSDGPEPCVRRPEACSLLSDLELVRRLPGHPMGWPLDLHVFRVLSSSH
jgi:4-amino-4-deoxy-L-arabinose transferase-like glycosyltransferase